MRRAPRRAAAALVVGGLVLAAAPHPAVAADPGGYGAECATKVYLIERLPETMHVIADLDGKPAANFVMMLLGQFSAWSVLVIANPETRLAGVYGFDDEGCAYPDGYVVPLGKAEALLDRALREGDT